MKRRQLVHYAGAGLLSAIGTGLLSQWQSSQAATPDGLTIKWLGHTCFLFTGGGKRVLVNPFENQGCTAKYRSPKVSADLVLASSLLLDEGGVRNLPGKPKILYEPGVYEIGGIKIQGVSLPHDRLGGRRFGQNVAWKWTQGGIEVLHLGGAAGPVELEQKILFGSPDLVCIPVGGGVKAYTPEEAKQAIQVINPKVIIPTHYRTAGAGDSCDLVGVDKFVGLMQGMDIKQLNSDSIRIKSRDLPQSNSVIRVLKYSF
ncbi:MBL fold metallo-hydrolase [Merismopedia glauca]|uniref:Zn-dependent hydrolase n=1 Tax=Merismopedia glauca CCAP 1448/3 TaxID=1296344 RepID=A0A2T1BZU6_9CYAN|nr:MBL fold metallo-hydrolase [Merismopedia glauca]PSB01447.1 Zn-dependent hydrolase [Merismopedia glauca CCAP 1448/3]